MARLLVQFPGHARVLVDGDAVGDTNRVIRLEAGEHTLELQGEATDPERHVVTVGADAGSDEIVRVGFGRAKEGIDRFSPLYCHNGFLLGQFLSLSFSKYGREQYAERRMLYEIGAAHALDKLSMLVVREDLADAIPANIGHDAIVKYSPDADDWPEGTVLLMAALISCLKVAAERGERLRVGSEGVEDALRHVGDMLKEVLVPPEAREAARRGRERA